MRNGTKGFVGIVSLGLVAAGYQAGLAAEISNGFSTTPVTNSASGETGSTAAGTAAGTSAGSETLNTSAPSATEAAPAASSTPAASSAPATSTAPASTPKATAAAPAASSTPKATTAAPAPVSTPKATTAAPAPATSSTTKTGSAINYRYGTVQVSVTKANGKITAVNLLQAGATGGREAAFSYLVNYAIQANGSSFGNLSGATFTVDAFKQSLESALAKF